jgi:hypothetical protein
VRRGQTVWAEGTASPGLVVWSPWGPEEVGRSKGVRFQAALAPEPCGSRSVSPMPKEET